MGILFNELFKNFTILNKNLVELVQQKYMQKQSQVYLGFCDMFLF